MNNLESRNESKFHKKLNIHITTDKAKKSRYLTKVFSRLDRILSNGMERDITFLNEQLVSGKFLFESESVTDLDLFRYNSLLSSKTL
jgi:hypothetical protein